MSAPAGVRYLAVVNLSAPPPRSGATLCTEALPNVRWPTRTARWWSTRAPATISAALALPPLTRTTRGSLWLRGGAGDVVLVRLLVEPVRAHHDSVVDEDRGHVDGLGEQAARIVAEIDDGAGCALLHEIGGGLLDLRGRPGREGEDSDVRELAALCGDEPRAQGRHLDLPAHEHELERLPHLRAPDRQPDGGARVPLDQSQRALERQLADGLAVDPGDDVALADAGLGRRARGCRRRRPGPWRAGPTVRPIPEYVPCVCSCRLSYSAVVSRSVCGSSRPARISSTVGRSRTPGSIQPVVPRRELGAHLVDQP